MEIQSPTLIDSNGFPIATRSLLLTVVASLDAMVDFTTLDDTFPRYVIEIDNLSPDTDSVSLKTRFSIAGDFKTGASDYSWTAMEHRSTSGVGTSNDDTDDSMLMSRNSSGVRWGSSGNENGDVTCLITRGGAGFYPKIRSTTMSNNDSNILMNTTAMGFYRGITSGATPSGGIDGIRFFFSTGLIQQGTFRLYGQE